MGESNLLLSTNDVAALVDVPLGLLRDWLRDGALTPHIRGGLGRGNSHYFTPQQTLGIMIAAALYQQDRRCHQIYVRKVYEAASATSIEELERSFRQGKTHFVTEHLGELLLRGKDYPDQVDCASLWRRIQRFVKLRNRQSTAAVR